MRTVVFSDEATAKAVNEKFVCAWVNKQPQTKFQDGLYKNLTEQDCRSFPLGAGVTNVTLIFATPDGKVISAVPGYLNVEAFKAEMEFALGLFEKMMDKGNRLKEDYQETYKTMHQNRAKVQNGPFAGRAHGRLAETGLLKTDHITYEFFDDFQPKKLYG